MVLVLEEVDSTNRFVRDHFDELSDGMLVVAKSQAAGRGRRGRVWVSPSGVNFTGSVLFRCLDNGFHAGCLLGLAALSLLRELAPSLPVYLKWPNDLYVEDRKLAGLLCESARIENGHVTAVVAGLGLNVNLTPASLRSIDQPATSLLAETGEEYNLDIFSEKLAEHVDRYYRLYRKDADAVIREWIASNLLIGESLTVVDPLGAARTGVFRRILDDGSMLLEEAGVPTVFTCGDVKVNRDSVDWLRLKQKAKNRQQ